MTPPKLYSWPESGNGYKIRLLASLLGIKLDIVNIDRRGNEHHSPEFLAINPRGQVPVLVDADKTFTDSAAILTYLAGSYQDPGSTKAPSSFWSNDVAEQAAIIDWLAFAASWVQTGVATARYIRVFRPDDTSASAQNILARATVKGHKSLEILQSRLLANEWLVLGRPTIADIAVFVYVSLAPAGNISLEPYPAIQSWISRIHDLPGFIPFER
jgi:glutathione S-transferase